MASLDSARIELKEILECCPQSEGSGKLGGSGAVLRLFVLGTL
jgi:hypothetical protein